jgi:phosphinothricin acetyltransferase
LCAASTPPREGARWRVFEVDSGTILTAIAKRLTACRSSFLTMASSLITARWRRYADCHMPSARREIRSALLQSHQGNREPTMPPMIRLATSDDADQVQAVYAPYCFTPISFELEPPSVGEMRARLVKVLSQYPWLLCEDGGDVLGYAYATQHRERAAYRWSVDTAVYVRQGRQRRGVGRALYTSLLAVLPLQGFVNAYAGVTLPNEASVGLHEAMRFEPVGVYSQVGFKCGAWHDVAWFQRPLRTRPGEPQPPRSLEEVRHTAEWGEALNGGRAVS